MTIHDQLRVGSARSTAASLRTPIAGHATDACGDAVEVARLWAELGPGPDKAPPPAHP
jgi:hypothetical protein